MSLAKTPLYDLHLELGAKMVPFAGYEMPVQYPLGVLKEHLHTRARAGLFDVSHMGQLRLRGADAAAALESLVPVDILDLPLGQQRYALFTNAEGGILDDLMVANAGDHLFLVVNAACKDQDLAHLRQHIGARCEIESLFDSHALLALQGPAAAEVLARFAPAVKDLTFMQVASVELLGAQCNVSRSGYTGEDGYEISVPVAQAEALARALLAEEEVQPIGLGARDSLRLEAGLCLYGHDMDSATTPVEASLGWAISKVRRADGERAGGFPGAERIFAQQREGVASKRVGLLPQERVPVREGAEIVDAQGAVIGKVSSGGFGPSLGAPVAMGYVASAHAALDSEVFAMVRGKRVPMKVARTPFVPQRYYRG
ncbi:MULTISPECIES: glycine cleavage system aminomethyltransferase GcvT [Pseudomonas]|uniref:glycine cleavage system aminomethyltransferase GcvT n=1 Tax=Pseudomonas TaxID=286 RepID=UPI0004D62257|nr:MULTISPECIES: glycine cleavage system aminomethyltransferase GcvT [Pseudomonas]AMO78097.1 Aminomethyltransferase [Pseudomonas citronellolis]KES22620.1 glycine cleavage system protein T [Pseudomonas sp. AAC]OHR93322.1 glycine cleavage system protein T [Pseudomonas sp. HMSC75E02]